MPQQTLSDVNTARRKESEFLALAAVLVLGIGAGALASSALTSVAVPALLVGCFTVAWAMLHKQRIEMSKGGSPAPWEAALTWGCWAAIGAVLAVVIWKSVGAS